MKFFLAFLGLVFFVQSASANILHVACQRYESKCKGLECEEFAGKLKQDREKKILEMPGLDKVEYVIEDTKAHAILSKAAAGAVMSNGRFGIDFQHVTQTRRAILLENKTTEGAVKEQVKIDKFTGFYSKYMLHTDGSIEDIPVGKPYTAYFGWCEDTTAQHQ